MTSLSRDCRPVHRHRSPFNSAVARALALVIAALVLLFATMSAAFAAAGETELITVGVKSGNAAGSSSVGRPAVSANGRYVLYGRKGDIFLRDRWFDVSSHIGVPFGGGEPNGYGTAEALTPDALFGTFSSQATNLVPGGDSNGVSDVFVRDRRRALERASINSSGEQANDASFGSAISDDARFVVFISLATNLGPANANSPPIFVRDRLLRTTRRLISQAPWPLTGSVEQLAMSGDGRYVAFDAQGPGPLAEQNVFVHDRFTGTTRRVSSPAGGDALAPSGGSESPSISADGRYVAFASPGNDFGPADADFESDIYVRDLRTGAITRESYGVTPSIRGQAFRPWLSGDGRFVTFESLSWNLVPGERDDNGRMDIYVRDRTTGAIERVSKAYDGALADHNSLEPTISRDGRWVVFRSRANNLVQNDFNSLMDVYIHDRGPTFAFTLRPVALDFGSRAVATSRTLAVTLTNTGTLALPLLDVGLRGTGSLAYTLANHCGVTVPVGGQCRIDVTFTPPRVGTFAARVRVEATAGVVRTSKLTGTGIP